MPFMTKDEHNAEHQFDAELTRLRADNERLREALGDVVDGWPSAFDALAPGFRHMKTGDDVATVNNFDQAVIRARAALASTQGST
jgi:hypothetical protein